MKRQVGYTIAVLPRLLAHDVITGKRTMRIIIRETNDHDNSDQNTGTDQTKKQNRFIPFLFTSPVFLFYAVLKNAAQLRSPRFPEWFIVVSIT